MEVLVGGQLKFIQRRTTRQKLIIFKVFHYRFTKTNNKISLVFSLEKIIINLCLFDIKPVSPIPMHRSFGKSICIVSKYNKDVVIFQFYMRVIYMYYGSICLQKQINNSENLMSIIFYPHTIFTVQKLSTVVVHVSEFKIFLK